jgi:hypothetical protein
MKSYDNQLKVMRDETAPTPAQRVALWLHETIESKKLWYPNDIIPIVEREIDAEVKGLLEALENLVKACPEPQIVSMGFDSPPEPASEHDYYLGQALYEARAAIANARGSA